jgi:hypothetical protein
VRVLVACEFSGIVRQAFLRRGHDAWSCDLCPGRPPTYGRHIEGDVRPLLRDPWDLVVAHPPCTRLCLSGVRWLHERRLNDDMVAACQFFTECLRANAPRVCVENPRMHGYAQHLVVCRPTQVIHPWMFGHGETKTTCLWLRGLPRLRPTKIVSGRRPGVHTLPPSVNRSALRSVTYLGVAEAMASQWGR